MSDGCDSGVHGMAVDADGCPCGLVRCDDDGPVDLMPLLRQMSARLDRMEDDVRAIRTAVMGEE